MKSASGQNNLKYPPRTECENIYKQFDLESTEDKESFKELAEEDKNWALGINDDKTYTKKMSYSGSGHYMCYCKKEGTKNLAKVL